jgi:negative regulator of replication initiation
MNETNKMYREIKKEHSIKKKANLEYSTNLLKEKNIVFESRNDGLHLIVGNATKYDFYPSTGLWVKRGSSKKQRGINGLLRQFKK